MSRHHSISIHHRHILWGELVANNPTVLTVQPVDTVTLEAFPARRKNRLSEDLSRVDDACMEDLNNLQCRARPHFFTDPLYVEGAHSGNALHMDILSAELTMDCGYVPIEPLWCRLPNEFTDNQTIHLSINNERGAQQPWNALFGNVR